MNHFAFPSSKRLQQARKPIRAGKTAGHAHATRRHGHQRHHPRSSSTPQANRKPPLTPAAKAARHQIQLWRDVRSRPLDYAPYIAARQESRVRDLVRHDIVAVMAVYCALPMRDVRLDLCRMISARFRGGGGGGGGQGVIASLMQDEGYWELLKHGPYARKVVMLLMFGYT